jgi:hypothetical protein
MSSQVLSEGLSIGYINLFTWGMPFAGFYSGVILRHFAFPGSLTFLQRAAVSVPASLILVAAFNSLLSEIGEPSPASIIFVTGFLMEQGLLIDIGLSAWLKHSSKRSD